MSWDFNMVIDIANGRDAEIFDGLNYTYNVSPMYVEAFKESEGSIALNINKSKGIRILEGLTGEEAKPFLEKAIKKMKDEPNYYKTFNPKNGWGNYEGALSLLEQLLEWAEYAPKAKFQIT